MKNFGSLAKTYNMDGAEFIRRVVADDLVSRSRDYPQYPPPLITMNLPAMAIEFLSAFNGLLVSKAKEEDYLQV